jgi:D-glycero-D-manno-heptose 1,7-bisphosphate phosphatase
VRTGRAPTGLTAVFLDRDGVINRKAPEGRYVTSWDEFAFLPGALEGLRLLAGSDLIIAVVTNQRGIARGMLTGAVLEDIHRRMRAEIAAAGGRVDAIYHCPHDVGCHCRKPEVGMFEAAAAQFDLVLAQTAVIGDQPSDMLAARRIGALPIGIGAEAGDDAEHVAGDLTQAVRWLLGSDPGIVGPTIA